MTAIKAIKANRFSEFLLGWPFVHFFDPYWPFFTF